MALLSKEGGTALITSLSSLWEFHTRLQEPFFYYCYFWFGSFSYFPLSEGWPETGAMSVVQPALKVFIRGGKPHLAFGQMVTAMCWCCPAKHKDMLQKCLFEARQLSKPVA